MQVSWFTLHWTKKQRIAKSYEKQIRLVIRHTATLEQLFIQLSLGTTKGNIHFSHSNQNPIGSLGLCDWGLIFNVLALALMFTLYCGAQTAKVKADTTKGHNLRCH